MDVPEESLRGVAMPLDPSAADRLIEISFRTSSIKASSARETREPKFGNRVDSVES